MITHAPFQKPSGLRSTRLSESDHGAYPFNREWIAYGSHSSQTIWSCYDVVRASRSSYCGGRLGAHPGCVDYEPFPLARGICLDGRGCLPLLLGPSTAENGAR